MNLVAVIRRHLDSTQRSRQMLEEVREGIANQTDVTNRHLTRLAEIMTAAAAEGAEARRLEQQRSSELTKQWSAATQPLRQEASNRTIANRTAELPPRSPAAAANRLPSPGENDLASREHIFDDITPWSGKPPPGYLVDWLGVLIDGEFRSYLGLSRDSFRGEPVQTSRPTIEHGEGWFEAVNQVEAARAARGRYVMVTLGACFGAQAVGSAAALRAVNPMPFQLVAVEPEPVNFEWTQRHFRDNDIDPDEHWLIKAAISDSNSPIFFPVGAPGSGAQNSYSTNESGAREHYVKSLIESGRQDEALRNLLLRNTTGLTKSLLPGEGFDAEITLLSAVTLADILAPLPFVDYVEADIQQSEILVFPPFMGLLKQKVRRVHIGTHGIEIHNALSEMFRRDGWDIIFDFEPNSSHTSSLGSFELNDGVLTALNPAFT